MGCKVIWTQLLDKICTPLLEASITTAILECRHCKNFGTMHMHALLALITWWKPFELLINNYLSLPPGKSGFSKLRLFKDMQTQKLWGFKSKSATGWQSQAHNPSIHSTRDLHSRHWKPLQLCRGLGILQKYWYQTSHSCSLCPRLNGQLQGSNGILLNALKQLCAPGLDEDDYKQMAL